MTEPANEPAKGMGWAGFGAVVAVAVAAILAWDWSRKAFALAWPIFGIILGAIAGKLLGPRGERALSAYRAWAAWQAVPAEASEQPDVEETATRLGMFIGGTFSLALVGFWPNAIALWVAALFFCSSVFSFLPSADGLARRSSEWQRSGLRFFYFLLGTTIRECIQQCPIERSGCWAFRSSLHVCSHCPSFGTSARHGGVPRAVQCRRSWRAKVAHDPNDRERFDAALTRQAAPVGAPARSE